MLGEAFYDTGPFQGSAVAAVTLAATWAGKKLNRRAQRRAVEHDAAAKKKADEHSALVTDVDQLKRDRDVVLRILRTPEPTWDNPHPDPGLVELVHKISDNVELLLEARA